jgi:hypothetical protein
MAGLQAMGEAHGTRGHSSEALALANKARYHEAVFWWSHRLARERPVDIWDMSTDQRHQLVVLLRNLNAEQWQTSCLCMGWTARDVVGHLVTPLVLGTGAMGFCRKVRFLGKIQKSGLRNSMTYRLSNSRKSNFATEPFSMPA